MRKNKKTSVIGVIITIIILIVIVIVSNIKIEDVTYVEGGLGMFVMPIQNGLTYFKNWVFGNNSFFININNLQEENQKLREKNSELEQSLRELEIIKSENNTLKEYVNLKDKYTEYETLPAYIINKDISNFSNTMVINAGSDNGVQVNMPVITTEGLVGYTISVTNKTAKVQPIIDPGTSISSSISTSRDSVIVKGMLR